MQKSKIKDQNEIKNHGLRRITCLWAVIGLLLMFSTAVGAGEAAEEEDVVVVVKEISGEVTVVGPSFIAVVYERDAKKGIEYEMALPIDKDIELVRKRNLDEIRVGDTVRVKYEETQKGERITRRAKVITFVKPAKTKLESMSEEYDVAPIGGLKEGERRKW